MVHASHDTVEEVETRERHKQLSVGRALLTGGLSVRKTVTRESRDKTDERHPVLYLFQRDIGRDAIILREQALRYEGLGADLDRSSHTNFRTLVRLLRERASQALYDDRLLSGRRPATRLELSGTSSRSVASASNADATDLAAHLLALAHAQGQL